MPADLVNLRQVRKSRARAAQAAEAAANRTKFGRTKAERKAQEAADDLARRHLDAHELRPRPDPSKPHKT